MGTQLLHSTIMLLSHTHLPQHFPQFPAFIEVSNGPLHCFYRLGDVKSLAKTCKGQNKQLSAAMRAMLTLKHELRTARNCNGAGDAQRRFVKRVQALQVLQLALQRPPLRAKSQTIDFEQTFYSKPLCVEGEFESRDKDMPICLTKIVPEEPRAESFQRQV